MKPLSSQQSVSLIVQVKTGTDADQQIWHLVRSLGTLRWRSEVLLVDPQSSESKPCSQRITYRPHPALFASLATAIQAAKHETIVLVDPGVKPEICDWQWMTQRRSSNQVQSYSQQLTIKQKYKQFLLTMYCFIVRVLLRTRKTVFNPGLIFVPATLNSLKNKLEFVDPQFVVPPLGGIPAKGGTTNKLDDTIETKSDLQQDLRQVTNNTELLSVLRLHQVPIEEMTLGSCEKSGAVAVPSSKQIFKAVKTTTRFWWNRIMFPLSCHADTTVKNKIARRWQWAASLFLLLAASGLLFTNLNYPLFEPDEARNAQLALNVIESGDWMSLQLAGEPYWDKPPLQIWSIAASYKIFGTSPFSTRLPGALATLMTLVTTLVLGKRLIGFRSAFCGSMLLVLCTGFVFSGRYVTMDASLTCWATLASLSLFIATQNKVKSFWMIVAGLAAGLGMLVKGPIIFVLCLPPVLLSCWLNQNRTALQPRRWLPFLVSSILVVSPWFIATTLVHPDFLVYFFWQHHVVRFSNAFNHREPFWYYLPMIMVMMFPASCLLPSLFKFAFSKNGANRRLRSTTHGFLILNSVWIIAFFSLSTSKLPTYILPALPALCLLMGVLLEKKVFAARQSGWYEATCAAPRRLSFLQKIPQRNTIGLCMMMITTWCVGSYLFDVKMIPWAMALAASVLFFWAVILTRKKNQSPQIAWAVWSVTSFCFVACMVNTLTPRISHSRSIHQAARSIQQQSASDSMPIIFFGRESYGSTLSLPLHSVQHYEADDVNSVCDFLSQQPTAIIIASDKEMKRLRKVLNWTILLEKRDEARHLFTSHPNRIRIADSQIDPKLK